MTQLRGFITLIGFILLVSCASAGKKYHQRPFKKISEKGNSVYYYLVSQLEELEGSKENSLFYLDKSIKKNPSSVHLIIEKAYHLARRDKYDEALKLALKAYEQEPQDKELPILLGKIYSAQGLNERAVDYFKKAIELNGEQEAVYELLARQYMAMQDYQAAIAIFKKILVVNPEYVPAYFYLGNIYTTFDKDFTKALQVYQNLLTLDPQDPKVLNLIAELHLAQKDYRKALNTFQKIKEVTPNDLKVQMRIGLLYYEMKDLVGAINTFEELLSLQPNSDKIIYYLGLLYQEKEDIPAALNYLKAIPPDSTYYVECVARQVYLLKRSGELDRALEVVSKAMKHSARRQPEFYELTASIHAARDEYEQALQVLKRALHKLDHSEKILFAIAVIYEQMGNWEQGIEYMKQVIALNEKNVLALNFVGYTYAERNERLDEAQDLIERALQIKPNDGLITDSLGWVFYQKGQYRKALSLLEKANRSNPGEAAILEHLGEVQLKLKNKRLARQYFEQSLFQLKKLPKPSVRDREMIERIESKMAGL